MLTNRKIKIIGDVEKERFFCEICQFPLLSSEDFEFDKDYLCCHLCYLEFAQSRKEEWKNGWRPKKAVVNSSISIRRKLYKHSSKEK